MKGKKWGKHSVISRAKQKRIKPPSNITIPFSENINYFWEKNSWFITKDFKILAVASAMMSELELINWLKAFNENPIRLTDQKPNAKIKNQIFTKFLRQEEKRLIDYLEKKQNEKSDLDTIELSYL